jgi:hypothetical protein
MTGVAAAAVVDEPVTLGGPDAFLLELPQAAMRVTAERPTAETLIQWPRPVE